MTESVPILLVEDNEDDVFFMRRALTAASISNPVFVAEDGQKAIAYLVGTASRVEGDNCPSLILLDLKLPVTKGLDVLAWLRQQPHLRGTVVLILTSSNEPSDIREAYRLGANSYLVKPTTTERLNDLAKALKNFWLEFNSFAPGS